MTNKESQEVEVMEEELDEEPFVKFVLVDTVKSTADIVAKTSLQAKDGIRLEIPRQLPLHLQHVFTDKKGVQRRTRFKQGSQTIFMDEQIKNELLPANEKFTEEERRMLYVINGALSTNDKYLKLFLHEDNNPQREEFTGRNRGPVSAIIRLLDEEQESIDENKFIFDTAEALVKIRKMDLEELHGLLTKFFGASYAPPKKKVECQNEASLALNDNEERVSMVLNGTNTSDDDIKILLSKALNNELVSFHNKPGYVQVKKSGEWEDAKIVDADSYETRERLFMQYLGSPQGELLKIDLENMIAEIDKEAKAKASKGKGSKKENGKQNS